MIPKIVTSDSFDFGDVAVDLVPLHRRGVDSDYLIKRASHGVFNEILEDMRPKAGKTVIHVIALGDEEKYGPNRNCDAFSRADNIEAHPSFKDIGHVFKNHKNDDPTKGVGEVEATAHNDLMSRVELLMELDNDKCSREVNALENGEDVPVSMGCFTSGHEVTLEDSTRILLEDLQVGDRVVTHTGEHHTVSEVMVRPHYGELYTIKAQTVDDIECTPNHQFYVLSKDEVYLPNHKTPRRKRVEDIDLSKAKWVRADELSEYDLLLTPTSQYEYVDDYLSVELVRLLGYYLAEGSIRFTPAGSHCQVILSCHKEDIAVTDVPKLCEKMGYSFYIRDSTSSIHGCSITIASSEFAYLCEKYCGKGAKTKKLDYAVMTWEKEYQKHFLGTYVNGDGCQANGEWQKGSVFISTASEMLRDQAVALLQRLGAVSGYQTLTHHAGKGFSAYNTTEYQVYLPKSDAHILDGYSGKVTTPKLERQRGGSRLRVGEYILTPIRAIEVTEAPETDPVDVYNCEVEGDHSYLISGVAVHNSMQDFDVCSHCGHKAPTARDHCEHVKQMLGMIMANGRKVYMKNPKPKYFDISLVYKPADRIAYTLRKVAAAMGAVIGGHELAEAFGLRTWTDPKTAALKALASMYKEVPAGVKDVIKPKSVGADTIKEVKKQSKVHGVDQLLGFLHSNGWLLSPRDFADVIGHKDPEAASAAIEAEAKLDDLMEDDTDVKSLALPSRQDKIPLSDCSCRDLDESSSMKPVATNARVVKVTIAKPESKVATITDVPEAKGLASLYMHYKLAFATQHIDRRDILRTVAATF